MDTSQPEIGICCPLNVVETIVEMRIRRQSFRVHSGIFFLKARDI